MFVPTESILEIVIRGSIMYIAMFVLLRIFRRQAGTVGIADLLVVVVIADAAQNGMAGDSKSITEAVILIGTIVLWDWVFDWAGYRSSLIGRLTTPEPLLLIKDGKLLRKNLEKELITEDDLMAQLRLQGLEGIEPIKKCYLESNGRFSVLTETDDRRNQQKGNDEGSGAVN
jgi:uncharacterized membrane protein YcaP (DUF421 family)